MSQFSKNQLASATNAFGINILRKLWQAGGEKDSVFISPSSISLALSMTLNGADGETRKQMAAVLGIDESQLDTVNKSVGDLIHALTTGDAEVKIEIANALFGKLGYPFVQQFLDTNVKYFGAEVTPLDLKGDPDGSLKYINDWVKAKTHDKIPSILDQMPEEPAMFLVNAIYFLACWQTKFDEKATTDREFTRLDGSKQKYPTMTQQDSYEYMENEDVQAVQLPYSSGRFNLCVVLPKDGKSVGDLVNTLTADTWNSWMRKFDSTPGTVYLPKFKIEYKAELVAVLKSLGMTNAFDEQSADFTRLVAPPDQVFINQVKHKTFVDVNEKGTEAAAVTAVGMVFATSIRMPLYEPFVLDVNRPFLCAICDNYTGAVLFIGAITEPK